MQYIYIYIYIYKYRSDLSYLEILIEMEQAQQPNHHQTIIHRINFPAFISKGSSPDRRTIQSNSYLGSKLKAPLHI